MVLEGYLKNYAIWMFHKKPAPKPGTKGPSLETDRPQSVGSRSLFYLVSIMPQILIKVSGNLKHPKNVKSISNTSVSHLVSCRVIPRPATMKMWENEVFWKIQALRNLKCNKSNNLESKQNPWRKCLKSNCIKSELAQKIFSSVFLKLDVTSLDSQEIVRTTVL